LLLSIRDIAIGFDSKYRIKRVHLEPEGKDLALTKTADGTRVVIPNLVVHTMVVVELD